MKSKNKVLSALLAITMLICMPGFTANAALKASSITFSKTSNAKVRVGYAITRAAVTVPEGLKVTYTSSDTDVATVTETGKVVGKKPGNTVITASAGGLKTSYNVTAVKADNVTATTRVFDGYKVTVLDKTTPAVNMRGRTNDRNVMCFVSASGAEVGAISYSDYNAIIKKNAKIVKLSGGGTYGAPPVEGKSWEAWFADEYNKYRGLTSDSRKVTVEKTNAEIVEQYRQELVKLVNQERKKVGLTAYIINDKCMEYSQIRAEELVTLFSHTRPDGTNAGYEVCTMVGKTPSEAVKAWMDSPPHKAALLNENRTYVGAGVHITSNGGYYWEMYFERDPEVYANTLILG